MNSKLENTLEFPGIEARIESLRERFDAVEKNISRMEVPRPIISEIDEWRYSTDAIFDEPPYQSEMVGIRSGRLLKKKFADFDDARLSKSVYSNGFVKGRYAMRIDPADKATHPYHVTHIQHRPDNSFFSLTIQYSDRTESTFTHPRRIFGLTECFWQTNSRRFVVGVGDRGNCHVSQYIYEIGKIKSVFMFATGPLTSESLSIFSYSSDGKLSSISASNGVVIWSAGDSRSRIG